VQTQYVATCSIPGRYLANIPSLSTWAFYVPLFGTLVNLGLLYWKRHNHPWNLLLLSTFTVMEAFTLGVVVAFYDNVIVMQAL
jgi:FtsH-binding integral membrane protein